MNAEVPDAARPALRTTPKWPFYAAGVMVLIAILIAVSMSVTVPYLAFSPGPVREIDEMVEVADPDPLTGEFYLLTVSVSSSDITPLEYLFGVLDPAVDLYERERIRPVGQSDEEYRERNRQSMDESKATAVFVALNHLGYDVEITGDGVLVGGLTEGSPVEGILAVDDVIVEVDGQPVSVATDLIGLITQRQIGDQVDLTIDRAGERIHEIVTLVPHVDDANRPMVGFLATTHNWNYVSPIDVDIDDANIGGPSAGLMYTLTLIDMLSDEDLAHGEIIAGTGTIDANGMVGSVGGVRQKVVSAEEAGATIMFVPAGNYEAALTVDTTVELVSVESLDDALGYLESLDRT